ncbi:AraC family transcriptional regulator [Secundilactobacillus folii]|uniref:Helix-turn-helix domain-containing protein n=1 Tax=Secundilactobacillus folii TaxID=2678357 RepID=A0A7X2XTY9_9LACO|nr:AraC family transcriptional regulator [Secundilactobacillus folii]MTV81638.1 helix-turn-helix domain-containing protein [Secundilactobacillus folii]
MTSAWLRKTLFKLTNVEKIQRDINRNLNYMDLDYINNPIPQMPQSDFFKDGDIAVTKNNRFSYVPAHTHNFVELNYMYSGECTQYINGEKVTLTQNNLIMMDRDIVQQIEYTDVDDILVNILIKDDSIINQLFDYIPVSSNDITQFLYNAAKINTLHNNFILFDLNNHDIALNIIENLIIKGLIQSSQRNTSMKLFLSSLIIELSQSIEQEYINFADTSDDRLLPILQYIDKNFSKISLKDVSAKFGYNTNYLGNKIKQTTGHTFKELVDQRRISAAQNLMIKTNCTLFDICDVVGYQNTSSLFRLFEKYLHTTPSAYKKKVSARPNKQRK